MNMQDQCKKAYEYLTTLSPRELHNHAGGGCVPIYGDEDKEYAQFGYKTLHVPVIHYVRFSDIAEWTVVELKNQSEKNKKLTEHVEILKEEISRLQDLLNIRNGEAQPHE